MPPVGVALYTTSFLYGKTSSRSSTPDWKEMANCDNPKSRLLARTIRVSAIATRNVVGQPLRCGFGEKHRVYDVRHTVRALRMIAFQLLWQRARAVKHVMSLISSMWFHLGIGIE